MEISVDLEDKKKNKFNFKKLITIIGTSLLLLILLYTIYFFERYILFSPIYLLLKLIFIIFHINYNNFQLHLTILSIIFTIIIQIFFIKIIILSIIFYSGGIFARFTFYDNFTNFIKQQINAAKKSIDLLYFSIGEFSKRSLNNSMSIIISFQKAYNNLKMAKNLTFETNQYKFGDYLNDIICQYNKFQEENYNSIEIKNKLINSLKSYKINLEPYINFFFLDIIIKFKFKQSLQLLSELLQYSFNGRKCYAINIYDDLNAYIILPEIENPKIKTLVVYCNQNAFNAEMYSFSQNNLKFYLDIKEITIMIWNYKGYGLRGGFPTFNSIDKDVEKLKEHINKYYISYKIIVHGISIGGHPAIKLAKILNDNKNVCLIADRTYSDIDLIAGTLIKNGKKIYNILFPKIFYKSDNIQNYIDLYIGNKFIFFDEEDKTIEYSKSSLIYNLTQKYYKEIILPKISNYKEYKNAINLFSSNFINLSAELRRIKNNSLDKDTLIFIKGLNKNKNNIENFLMFFLVFGYPFNIYKEINYDKIIFSKNYINLPEIMRKINETYNSRFSEKLINFISYLNFLFIKSNLIVSFNDNEIISFNYNNDNNDFSLQEGFQENLLKYFGYVHRLFCGHNGVLEENDEQYLKKYLELNEFIKESNNRENSKDNKRLFNFK